MTEQQATVSSAGGVSELAAPPVRNATSDAAPWGPVSAQLVRELKTTIKKKGLVVWLDAESQYSDLAQALAQGARSERFPYDIVQFDGSFLELMLGMEQVGNALYPDKVLVYVPGWNDKSIAETPLFELHQAGHRFQRALDTLIQEAASGSVRQEEIAQFVARHPLSLAGADEWLAQAKRGVSDVFLVGLEDRDTWSVLRELFADESKLLADLAQAGNRPKFLQYVERAVGLPLRTWSSFLLGNENHALFDDAAKEDRTEDLRYFVGSWLMVVEYISDLLEPPVLGPLRDLELSKPVVAICREQVGFLRQQCADRYRSISQEFEAHLYERGVAAGHSEITDHRASALGSIDTFRFEEAKVRDEALGALISGDWEAAVNYATQRHPERCFWVQHDQARKGTWELIRLCATAGHTIARERKGLEGCSSLEEAMNRYHDSLHQVDRAHRLFEHEFHRLHTGDLDDEARLREARDVLRDRYRVWADQLAGQFAELCETYGPLPSSDLRQRAVYEQFVHPQLEQGTRVAFFMVDALRFEMAVELREAFEGKKFKTTLQARLAELPTVTEVGMNALAPVSAHGKLRLVVEKSNSRKICGFRKGEKFTVHSPDTRVKAMESRSVPDGAIHLELGTVTGATEGDLKKILRSKRSSPLIVVRSLELDSAGEKGFHLGTFQHTLMQIREAVQRLAHAGIHHFVLAADHGFLLQDATAKLIPYKDSPQRRHVLTPQAAGMGDALEIPLSALDYEVDQPAYLVFRKDTAAWKTQEKIAPFVHGGNSLQERVIPVLQLERGGKSGSSTSRYEVVARALPPEVGRQRLSLQLRLQKQSSGTLSFASPKRISLALRVPGHDVAPQIIEVTPPGVYEKGALAVPPGAEESTITFLIEGTLDEKVRVEIYHPDGTEQVQSQIVEGWFDMRSYPRRRDPVSVPPPSQNAAGGSESTTAVAGSADVAAPPEQAAAQSEAPPSSRRAHPAEDWRGTFEDADFAEVFMRIDQQESVNEQEMLLILKNARRARSFSRRFDELKRLVPFDVEIIVHGGMKVYAKGGGR